MKRISDEEIRALRILHSSQYETYESEFCQAQLEACEKEAQEKVGEILDSLISENRRLSVELQKDRIERPTDYEGHKVLRSKKKSIQFAISIVKKHLGGEWRSKMDRLSVILDKVITGGSKAKGGIWHEDQEKEWRAYNDCGVVHIIIEEDSNDTDRMD